MPTSPTPAPALVESIESVTSANLDSAAARPLRASRLFVILLVAIFAVELGIMWALRQMPELPPLLAALLDATMLAVLVFPAIYLLCFRPMQAQMQARVAVEADLQSLNQSLEQRMAARTQELEVINKGLQRAMAAALATEKSLQQSLREQEALLKEVHHRVKNNLQVINSLLRLESSRHPEPGTKTVLREMQGRIHSMALLHESLYRTGNYAAVNLADYLRQLATRLIHGHTPTTQLVKLALDINPVMVGMEEAIPCGLIVNELLTNALKHGFADGRNGTVSLMLTGELDGRVLLRVSDDGVGLPPDFDTLRQQSLGLQLIDDLTQQLQGLLTLGPGPGTSFTIEFKAKVGGNLSSLQISRTAGGLG
ncbi:MAG: hypothetical protein K9M98_10260 [Cephaloticoccus sp.]|nr:hypothetical protein [Cephaloticoccus sp.]